MVTSWMTMYLLVPQQHNQPMLCLMDVIITTYLGEEPNHVWLSTRHGRISALGWKPSIYCCQLQMRW